MSKALLQTDDDPYKTVTIPKEKYEKIVQGRNRFFVTSILAVGLFIGATSLPQYLINRSAKHLYRTYCRGKVLDLTPKLYDAQDVSFYEMSRAVLVQFIVEQRVVDDGHYRIDESLTPEEQEERRRAMTLDYMLKNDHHWYGSSVNFSLVERAETQAKDFSKYDCVVIRDELMNRRAEEARQLFDSPAAYLKPDGHFLLMDYGKSSNPTLDKMAVWFNKKTGSSMSFTHQYHQWIQESLLYEVVEERRNLFGFRYSMVMRLKRTEREPVNDTDKQRIE